MMDRAKVEIDAYTKVVTKWMFLCAGFEWSLVREDETHVAATGRNGWLVGLALTNGKWWLEGTDDVNVHGERMARSISDQVFKYIVAHGIPDEEDDDLGRVNIDLVFGAA